jgi:hypothetical protein
MGVQRPKSTQKGHILAKKAPPGLIFHLSRVSNPFMPVYGGTHEDICGGTRNGIQSKNQGPDF